MKIKLSYGNIEHMCEQLLAVLGIVMMFVQIAAIEYASLAYYALLGISALLGIYIYSRYRKVISQSLVWSYLILLIIAGLNFLIIHQVTIGFFISVFLIHSVIALFLSVDVRMSKGLWAGFSVVLSIYIVSLLAKSTDGYSVFAYTGRNYVSVYGLVALTLIMAQRRSEGKKELPLYGVLGVFAMSLFARGRGGILATGFLVIALLVYRLFIRDKRITLRKVLTVTGAFVAIIFLMLIFIENSEFILVTYFPRFAGIGSEGSSSAYSDAIRMGYMDAYLGEMVRTPVNFLLGINVHQFFSASGGNTHNSIFQLHANLGFVGVAMIAVGFWGSIKRMLKLGDQENVILLLALLIRSLTDQCFPNLLSDVVFMYFLMYPRMKNKNRRKLYSENAALVRR